MYSTIYYVASCEGGWGIRHDDTNYGPYPDEQTAVDIAIVAAQSVRDLHGYDVRVVVEDVTGLFHTQWPVEGRREAA